MHDMPRAGFNLFYGNDADALVERLAARLTAGDLGPRLASEPSDLLAPEIILVPQFGLRRWLEIRLAEQCGIIANVNFFAPAEFAWRLLRHARPQLGETSQFERGILRWRIFAELAALARVPECAPVARMLGDGSQTLRWRLADELSHLFERYLAYRSDLLARWERATDVTDWQAELWRRLVRGSAEPHRARLLEDYLRQFNDSTAPPGVPHRIFAFACTNISPDLLRFYGVVARHCELDFFMQNPCREYWGDVGNEREQLRVQGGDAFAQVNNPLLAANGRAGRDFLAQVFSYEQVQPSIEVDLSIARGQDTLLHALQSDILNLEAAPSRVQDSFASTESSLQFHRCHSRLREVQVLHDRLLDLFQQDATLTPRDVAVMAPDISAYAPYIDAVFGGVARDDPRYLPYAISDARARETHPLLRLALSLASLPASRMGLGDVIEIFAVPAVLRKIGLDSNQLSLLEDWLRGAGVRWGIDEAQHERAGAGRYREFTWAFGIDRLLMGFASGECDDLIAGIAPDAAIEGASAQSLGALLNAFGALKKLLALQAATHSARRWQEIYNEAFTALLDIADDDSAGRRALERIHSALAAFAEQAATAGLGEALDWQCVRDVLEENLNEPERGYRFFTGGISVCGMVPLRAVPFRVLCVLGMNEDVYPRRDRVSSLSRLRDAGAAGQPPARARSDRDEDRYLFLQLLTCVRDVFYVSWVGEDQRDGTQREPSAVVAELIDTATRYLPVDGERATATLVLEHPMQAFSPRNFGAGDPRMFSYRRESFVDGANDREPNQAASSSRAVVDTDFDESIQLEDLRRFMRAPVRRYLSESLGMRIESIPESDADDDTVALGGLERYALRDALIGSALRGDGLSLEQLRARALLPAGRAALSVVATEGGSAETLLQALLDTGISIDAEQQPFELKIDVHTLLLGRLPLRHETRAVRWFVGRLDGKRLLDAWLDFLVLIAADAGTSLDVFGVDKDNAEHLVFAGIDAASALASLRMLLKWWRGASTAPPLFFPRAALEYVQSLRKAKDAGAAHADALNAAMKVFDGNDHSPGEGARDPAFALLARQRTPFLANTIDSREFTANALAVFEPLLAASRSA